jgi:DMSO reductase family type II enzyme heme b subunit
MRIPRVTEPSANLLDADDTAWTRIQPHRIALMPSPVAMAAAVSLQLSLSVDHGKVPSLSVRMAHDGETLSTRLSWRDAEREDRIDDLDRFVDAAAVMFPLAGNPNPLTMGEEGAPVNLWLWRADHTDPFDVIAHGYSTSQRRPAAASGLVARGVHRAQEWAVVFQRPLRPAGEDFVAFQADGSARIAFAVWEGSNADRAGQKAVSPEFLELKLDR